MRITESHSTAKMGTNLWCTRLMDQHEYSPSQNRDFITMHWGMIGKQMLKLKKLKKRLLSIQSKKTKTNIQNLMCPEQL